MILILCLITFQASSQSSEKNKIPYGISGQTLIKINDGHISALRIAGGALKEINTTSWNYLQPPERIFSSSEGAVCKLLGRNAYVLVTISDRGDITAEPFPTPKNFIIKQLTAAKGILYAYVENNNNRRIFPFDLIRGQWLQSITVPDLSSKIPLLAVQSNGRNDNLYVFDVSKEKNFSYDFIDKNWNALDDKLDFSEISSAYQACSIGAYAVLLASNSTLYYYNTITDTFSPHPSDIGISNEENLLLDKDGIVHVTDGTNLYSLTFEVNNHEFGAVNYIVLVIYLFILIGIGIYYSRRQVTTEDYFKGGGRIPWWAAGISLFGTGLSAITFMAIPAKTFATDWSYFLFQMTPLLAVPIVIKIFIPFFKRLNVTSAYQYLELRFNLLTRLFGSLSFLIFQLGRVGVVLYLPAIALNMVTDISISTCIVAMGSVSVIYTLIGGIEAVIWTDVLQVIILLGGAIFALVVLTFSIPDGVSYIYDVAISNHKFEILNFAFDFTNPTFWVVVLGGFFANLITSGSDQSMVQRYLTTSNEKSAKKSAWVFAIMAIPATLLFFSIGTSLFTYYKTYPKELDQTMQISDAVFPWYIINNLPIGISGLVIAGIFSAAMSSLSSSMNSAATVFIEDFYQRLIIKGKNNNLAAARVSTFIFGVAGCAFALLMVSWDIKSLWDQFQLFIGLFAGGLGGLFLLGMTTTRSNGAGAVIGLLLSGCIQYYLSTYTNMHVLLFTGTGVVSCYVLSYVFSIPLGTYNKSLKGLTIYTMLEK